MLIKAESLTNIKRDRFKRIERVDPMGKVVVKIINFKYTTVCLPNGFKFTPVKNNFDINIFAYFENEGTKKVWHVLELKE